MGINTPEYNRQYYLQNKFKLLRYRKWRYNHDRLYRKRLKYTALRYKRVHFFVNFFERRAKRKEVNHEKRS